MPREYHFEHAEAFASFLPQNGVPKAAANYMTWMNNAAKGLERRLGPRDLSTEEDITYLIRELIDAGKGNSGFRFVRGSTDETNLRSVFRKYVRMVESDYQGLFPKASIGSISPRRFRAAFERFQAIHEAECGWPVKSFSSRDSFAFQWEGYKHAIPERAGAVLNAGRWTRNEIGSGEILKRVIGAIELPGNNLLQWEARNGPASRAHSKLIDLRDNPDERFEIESLFHDLYKGNVTTERIFEGIVRLCGKKYELLGYLFFIADPSRFLPIRTQSFDRAFVELGVELKTESKCSWKNYCAYNDSIREVRNRLHAEGIADASLLDAHSFCWILARYAAEGRSKEKPAGSPKMRHFEGEIKAALPKTEFSPNDDVEVRDMNEKAVKCRASGEVAEEIAMSAEKARLAKEGRADLAARVESVAHRPGFGYDIKSFEVDGTDRFIEVKNVSNGKRFFLSEWEWLNSRERPNYWFYLVSAAGTENENVSLLPAILLKEQHLNPVQYLVKYE